MDKNKECEYLLGSSCLCVVGVDGLVRGVNVVIRRLYRSDVRLKKKKKIFSMIYYYFQNHYWLLNGQAINMHLKEAENDIHRLKEASSIMNI